VITHLNASRELSDDVIVLLPGRARVHANQFPRHAEVNNPRQTSVEKEQNVFALSADLREPAANKARMRGAVYESSEAWLQNLDPLDGPAQEVRCGKPSRLRAIPACQAPDVSFRRE
jgi:hypothetical protein